MTNFNPTPLQKFLFKIGMDLQWLHEKSKVSYPTLVNINHGFRSVVKRDKTTGKIISKSKKKFTPEIWTLMQIAKAFRHAGIKVKPEEIYEDRSGE